MTANFFHFHYFYAKLIIYIHSHTIVHLIQGPRVPQCRGITELGCCVGVQGGNKRHILQGHVG